MPRRLFHSLLQFLRTLRGFVFVSTSVVAFVVFLGTTVSSTVLYEHLLDTRNTEISKEIAEQNVRAIQDVMRRGGSRRDMEEVMAATKAAFPKSVERIGVYRSEKVERLFGATQQPAPGGDVRAAMEQGREIMARDARHLQYAYPIKAARDCLNCHTNAVEGDVLGVLWLQHNVQTVTAKVRMYYIAIFLGLGAAVLLVALALTSVVAGRLKRSAQEFIGKVETIHTLKDLDGFDVGKTSFGFAEFDHAFHYVALLVEKIRQVAVDKSVLEFEIRLLEKFIITTNVVRDWREFIKNLLLEITPIIEAYALVTLFRVEEEGYECEVFWRHPASPHTTGVFEAIMRRQVQSNPHFQSDAPLHIAHHVAEERGRLPDLSAHDIELQTKTLFLETPRIGGIVGIGVQSVMAPDNIRHMVIGSILTTLLNLVGSVKAIHKYTKDLEHYATRDPLTDLYNQRMFWELLGYEIGRARRHEQSFAVMMLDIDNFKVVNDRFGHPVGDALLQAVARLLHAAVREGDLVMRYGGDEFCIILPEAGDMQAHMIAQRIVERLGGFSLATPEGIGVSVTTSIGIAIYPTHADNPKDLFLVADNMMYKAKRAGKNAVAIPSEEEMAEVFRKAGEKAIMIQNALAQESIVPYFQPICSVPSGDVVIHELLMRIRHDGEIVEAREFIEEAEGMGIAHKMDYQLIGKAFAQIRQQGYEGMLFVNLSPKALIIGEFSARVGQLAEQYGIPPQRIVFEITERETVKNITLLEKFVVNAKLQGFSFAIDDFGSGYSSFHYIKRFPIDYIKIEGEFIRNMLRDEVYLAFVKSIVTLANELGIKTVAEHVEDEEILAALKDLGIGYAQGYHIGSPSPRLGARSQAGQAATRA